MRYSKIIGLLFLIQISLTLKVSDFKPALFHTSQPSGLYTVETGTPNSGQVLSFGDINGDKYTDYVGNSDPKNNIVFFYLWNDASSSFIFSQSTLNNSTFLSIAEMSIVDIDSDGLGDLLVTYVMSDQSFNSQIYHINCSSKGCVTSFAQYNYSSLEGMSAVPFPLDVYGDGSVGIFTFKGNNRSIVFINKSNNTLLEKSFSNFLSMKNITTFRNVSSHFSSQIDINGDCFSDLVIVSNQNGANSIIQVYYKGLNNLYIKESEYNLNKSISWLTFADIDSNGAIDIFLLLKDNNSYNPYISYNKNRPDNICTSISTFPFNFDKLAQAKIPQEYIFLNTSNPKFGDVNFDGFPDILGIYSYNDFRTASILVNQGGHNFAKFSAINIEQIQKIGNPKQVSFYDFTQNGKLDIIVISQVTKQDKTTALVRTSIVNNIIEDTLFIKILPLSPASSNDLNSKTLTSAIGVTVSWRITNIDGDKTISLLNQKFQWNYGILQLPFVTSGLGRTNNYIEELTVGYPGYAQLQSWTPIIPNSQLMVERVASGHWILETLLKDNSRVYDVIYISVLFLLLMGLVIIFLNWRQAQEDKRDHYNFIQMIR